MPARANNHYKPLCARRRLCGLRNGVLVTGLVVSFPMMADSVSLPTLTQLAFEDLMQIEVTTVSKKAEPWFAASAAIYVLTQDDLRRSGAATIADALRTVPGVNVAQLDSNMFAVSVRGFNHLYADKLLVLVDGRSTYSSTYSGVHWDTIDTVLEDIDRIEVIRGPGATLWGANAVNGVINIITKKSDATKGTLASVALGDKEDVAIVRHGGAMGEDASYRAYVKYSNRVPSSHSQAGEDEATADDWRMARVGFRTDWRLNAAEAVSVQGDVYSGALGETLNYPDLAVPFSFRRTERLDMNVAGANLIGRWTKRLQSNGDVSLQLYYDRIERDEEPFRETHDTFDLDVQHNFPLSARNVLVWGAGYRHTQDHTQPSFRYGFNSDVKSTNQQSLFFQDEFAWTSETVATFGVKFEHYAYTGLEVQPNLRLAWSPNTSQTVWGAVSQAVRTPSRNDTDVNINVAAFRLDDGSIGDVRVQGNPNIDSEKVTAYELGYRMRPTAKVYLDLAVFYNVYRDILGTESLSPYFETDPAPAHLVMPLQFANDTVGRTQGFELASTWQASESARLSFGYSFLEMDISAPNGYDLTGNSPRHQVNARLFYDFSKKLHFDTMAYYVDELIPQDRTQLVSAYTRVDFRLAWDYSQQLELAAGIRNAFDGHHPEFASIPFVVATELDRSIYGKLSYRF